MAARAKSKADPQDPAQVEAAAIPPESVSKRAAGKAAASVGNDKSAAADKKTVKKKSPEKSVEKGAASSAKGAKHGSPAKAEKAGEAGKAPVNPAIAWPFPLGPRPQ